MLATPINPLDILVLQNKYPVKAQHFEEGRPIPGFDGIAEVMKCGSNFKQLIAGDKFIVKRHGLGIWRTHACFSTQDVLQIPGDMDPMAAALLRMGILMAFLMLKENASVAQPGDWIIMNGATGVIAHFLGQFAHAQGLKVASVIRDRPAATAVADTLRNHAADSVLTESELGSTDKLQDRHIVLAFDAVFGPAGQSLASALSPGGVYISYGFMGGWDPSSNISISQPLIVLRNIVFKAFRFSSALAAVSDEHQRALCIWILEMLATGSLTMPLIETVTWSQREAAEEKLKDAVRRAISGEIGQQKQVFVFTK